MAYYHFDQGTAGGDNSGVTTLTDATSNSYDGTLQNFALTGSTSNWVGSDALPVELTSFTAQANGNNNVILNWETATEVNNYGFEIERKIECLSDGMNEWEKRGFVEGYGNSNSPKSYTFIDDLNLIPNPNLIRIYYRLKQIDLDGSYEYYNTIAEVNLGITSVNGEVLPTEFGLS